MIKDTFVYICIIKSSCQDVRGQIELAIATNVILFVACLEPRFAIRGVKNQNLRFL